MKYYEVRVFDGSGKPLITAEKSTEEGAIKLAKMLVEGEEITWRAEVWSPEGKQVYPLVRVQ